MKIRAARRILQIGALLVVMAVTSGPLFDLDRFQVPKELFLHLAAFGALVLVLRSSRSLSFGVVDCLLIGFALVSSIAAVAAPNGWVAFRARGNTRGRDRLPRERPRHHRSKDWRARCLLVPRESEPCWTLESPLLSNIRHVRIPAARPRTGFSWGGT